MAIPQIGATMFKHKCGNNCCDIFVPSCSALKQMSHEGRMRAFLFAATGDKMYLQFEHFVLPANEFDRVDSEEE